MKQVEAKSLIAELDEALPEGYEAFRTTLTEAVIVVDKGVPDQQIPHATIVDGTENAQFTGSPIVIADGMKFSIWVRRSNLTVQCQTRDEVVKFVSLVMDNH